MSISIKRSDKTFSVGLLRVHLLRRMKYITTINDDAIYLYGPWDNAKSPDLQYVLITEYPIDHSCFQLYRKSRKAGSPPCRHSQDCSTERMGSSKVGNTV